MDEQSERSSAIEAANRQIHEAIETLPHDTDPAFWPTVLQQDAAVLLEVLVHLLRRFLRQGRTPHVERAGRELMHRAYPIARGVVGRRLPYSRRTYARPRRSPRRSAPSGASQTGDRTPAPG